MLLLMLVTRLASPGPVFYRQRRVGLGGRQFMIWKFRTMKVSAETQTHERYYEELIRTNCAMTKLDANGDARLAPFGRILRASGLDELPQIFNVLAGEMSLVGPRPCLPNEFANYEPWQCERVNGLPGSHRPLASQRQKQNNLQRDDPNGPGLSAQHVAPSRSKNHFQNCRHNRARSHRMPTDVDAAPAEPKS